MVYIENTCFIYNIFDFFFDSSIDFKDAGGPPMLTGPLPDPKTPPNPQKSIFPWGGAPSNALLTRVGRRHQAARPIKYVEICGTVYFVAWAHLVYEENQIIFCMYQRAGYGYRYRYRYRSLGPDT